MLHEVFGAAIKMEPKSVSGYLKIANWNLERAHPSQRRLSEIQAHLHSNEADVWFLTETHDQINPREGYFGCLSGNPDRQGLHGERWAGIWSRWEIEPLVQHVSDRSRCVAGRIAESPFGELILFGLVLPWTNAWKGIPGVKGQAFEAALNEQSSDWLRLRRDFPGATMIVAGDFNQDLSKRHYYGSKRKRALLEIALARCGLSPVTAGSNDPIARDSSPMACIDHICISPFEDWAVKSTRRWPEMPRPVDAISDHFGVIVEVGMRKSRRA